MVVAMALMEGVGAGGNLASRPLKYVSVRIFLEIPCSCVDVQMSFLDSQSKLFVVVGSVWSAPVASRIPGEVTLGLWIADPKVWTRDLVGLAAVGPLM